MSYRSHLASVVMALLDDGEGDDRNPEQNSPNQFELFSDYPTVVTFNTAEFLLENSQIIDFRIQGAPTNEDAIAQNEPQNEEAISESDDVLSQENNEQQDVLFQENNEQQGDQNQYETGPDNPNPIVETVEVNDNNSQEIAEYNNHANSQVEPNNQDNEVVTIPSTNNQPPHNQGNEVVTIPSTNNQPPHNQGNEVVTIPSTNNQPPRQLNVWRRRNRRRNPSTEEPSETLTSMSVQGLDCPYVTINDDGVYQCMKCDENRIAKTFKHKYSFQRHAFLYHEGARKVFPCPQCNQEFSRPDKTIKHMKTEHNQQHAVETINKAVLFKPSNFSVEMFKMN